MVVQEALVLKAQEVRGQYNDSVFDVNYQLDSSNVVTEAYNGSSIAPGDSAEFSFSTLLYDTSDVDGILCTWTSKGSDFDISNDTTCINVSIDVNSGIESIDPSRGHSAYPNPVSDHLTIEFNNPEFNSFELVIYDLIGRSWIEINNITGDNYFIKAGTLPSGLYLYSLKGKGKTFNGRFFVN